MFNPQLAYIGWRLLIKVPHEEGLRDWQQ